MFRGSRLINVWALTSYLGWWLMPTWMIWLPTAVRAESAPLFYAPSTLSIDQMEDELDAEIASELKTTNDHASHLAHLEKRSISSFLEAGVLTNLNHERELTTSVDLFCPLELSYGRLLYFNPRFIVRSQQDSLEGNLHLGYRQMFSKDQMFGGMVSFDRRKIDSDFFNQITLGIEYAKGRVWVASNVYLPIGRTSGAVNEYLTLDEDNVAVAFTAEQNTAHRGADVWLGLAVAPHLNLYLRGFAFGHNQAYGGSASLEFDHTFKLSGLPNRLTIALNAQSARYIGTSLSLGIKLKSNLAQDQNLLALDPLNLARSRMADSVRRDLDIVVTKNQTSQNTIHPQDLPLNEDAGFLKQERDWFKRYFNELCEKDLSKWRPEELERYRVWLLTELNLASDLDAKAVKAAWRNFSLAHHPDRSLGNAKFFMQQQPYFQELIRIDAFKQQVRFKRAAFEAAASPTLNADVPQLMPSKALGAVMAVPSFFTYDDVLPKTLTQQDLEFTSFKARRSRWQQTLLPLAARFPDLYLDKAIYAFYKNELTDLEPLNQLKLDRLNKSYQRFFLVNLKLLRHKALPLQQLDRVLGAFNDRQQLDVLARWLEEYDYLMPRYDLGEAISYQGAWAKRLIDSFSSWPQDMQDIGVQLLHQLALTKEQQLAVNRLTVRTTKDTDVGVLKLLDYLTLPTWLIEELKTAATKLLENSYWTSQDLEPLFGDASTYASGLTLLTILELLLQHATWLTPSAADPFGRRWRAVNLSEALKFLNWLINCHSLRPARDLDQLLIDTYQRNANIPDLRDYLAAFKIDYLKSLKLIKNWVSEHYPIVRLKSNSILDPSQLKSDALYLNPLELNGRLKALEMITPQGAALLVKEGTKLAFIDKSSGKRQLTTISWSRMQQELSGKTRGDFWYQLANKAQLLEHLLGNLKPLTHWTQPLLDLNDQKAFLNLAATERQMVKEYAATSNDFSVWCTHFKVIKPKQRSKAELMAVLAQALFNTKGYYPRASQMLAVYLAALMPRGVFLEIATGEGKSAIIAMITAVKMLTKSKVDVSTSSSELAQRDAKEYANFYQHFGWFVGDNTDEQLSSGEKLSYRADVVYGDINHFIGDDLHQRLLMPVKGTRGLGALHVVDEVDNLFIDNLNMLEMLGLPAPGFEQLDHFFAAMYVAFKQQALLIESRSDQDGCYLSTALIKALQKELTEAPEAADAEGTLLHKIIGLLKPLKINQLIKLIKESQQIKIGEDCSALLLELLKHFIKGTLLKVGAERSKMLVPLPDSLFFLAQNESSTWSKNLLYSFSYQNGVDYLISNNTSQFRQIVPLDGPTGVQMPMLQWGGGLHTFIELREGLAPKQELMPAVFQYFKDYFQQYPAIIGLTGTLGAAPHAKMLEWLYHASCIRLPSFAASRRTDCLPCWALNENDWYQKIKQLVHQYLFGAKRPVLVIFNSVNQAKKLRLLLNAEDGLAVPEANIRMYTKGESEDRVLERPLDAGEVIIATNLAGRGADIKLTSAALAAGGLHVLKTSFEVNLRVEQQAFGRAGRQGQPGSAQLVIALDEFNRFMDRSDQAVPSDAEWPTWLARRDALAEDQINKISELAKWRQTLSTNLFNEMTEFREQLVSSSRLPLQLLGRVGAAFNLSALEDGIYVYKDTLGRMYLALKQDSAYKTSRITALFSLVLDNFIKDLSAELNKLTPKLTRLGQRAQQLLRFLSEFFWPDSVATKRFIRAKQSFDAAFKKHSDEREAYWHKVTQRLFAEPNLDEYVLYHLINDYPELLPSIELPIAKLQHIIEAVYLKMLFNYWLNDAIASWDEALLSDQLIEDWGMLYASWQPLINVDAVDRSVEPRLQQEFNAFKQLTTERLANDTFYRNPGYLLKSIRKRSPLSSQDGATDSFSHCLELSNQAIKASEGYDSKWMAYLTHGNLNLAYNTLGIKKQQEKVYAMSALEEYLTFSAQAKASLEQNIAAIISFTNLMLAHQTAITSDYSYWQMALGEFYQQVITLIEDSQAKVRQALDDDKTMVTIGARLTFNEVIANMNVTRFFDQHLAATGANVTLKPLDYGQQLLQQVENYGFMFFALSNYQLKSHNLLHYLGAAAFSLAEAMVGAAVTMFTGGVFGNLLGFNLVHQGLSSLLNTAILWHKKLPISFSQIIKGQALETVYHIVLGSTLTLLDHINFLDVKNRIFSLNKAKKLSVTKLLGKAAKKVGVSYGLNAAALTWFKRHYDASENDNLAMQKVQKIFTSQHDALARICLTDSVQGSSMLVTRLQAKLQLALSAYQRAYNPKLQYALSAGESVLDYTKASSVASYAASFTRIIVNNQNYHALLGKLGSELTSSINEVAKDSLTHQELFNAVNARYVAGGTKLEVNGSVFNKLDQWNCHNFTGILHGNVSIPLTDSCTHYKNLVANPPKLDLIKRRITDAFSAVREDAKQQVISAESSMYMSLVLNEWASVKASTAADVKDSFKEDIEPNNDAKSSLSDVVSDWSTIEQQIAASLKTADKITLDPQIFAADPKFQLARKSVYRTKTGDTLDTIAKLYRVSSQELTMLNPGLLDASVLEAGQVVKLPILARKRSESNNAVPKPAKDLRYGLALCEVKSMDAHYKDFMQELQQPQLLEPFTLHSEPLRVMLDAKLDSLRQLSKEVSKLDFAWENLPVDPLTNNLNELAILESGQLADYYGHHLQDMAKSSRFSYVHLQSPHGLEVIAREVASFYPGIEKLDPKAGKRFRAYSQDDHEVFFDLALATYEKSSVSTKVYLEPIHHQIISMANLDFCPARTWNQGLLSAISQLNKLLNSQNHLTKQNIRELEIYRVNLLKWQVLESTYVARIEELATGISAILRQCQLQVNDQEALKELIGHNNCFVIGVRPLTHAEIFTKGAYNPIKHMQLFFLSDGEVHNVGFLGKNQPLKFLAQRPFKKYLNPVDRAFEVMEEAAPELAKYRFSRPIYMQNLHFLTENSDFRAKHNQQGYQLLHHNCQDLVLSLLQEMS